MKAPPCNGLVQQLTPARRNALLTLASYGAARRSNTPDHGFVYWQSGDWLESHGLASLDWAPNGGLYRITDLGRLLAEEAAG